MRIPVIALTLILAGSLSALPPAPVSPDWVYEGGATYAAAGPTASIGDHDGDGYDDILVGLPGASSGNGRVDLFRGAATGLSSTPAGTFAPPSAKARFGSSVASAGDINGDGHGDLLIGAPRHSATVTVPGSSIGVGGDSPTTIALTDAGAVYVYYGSAAGFVAAPQLLEGTQASANFGSAVASAGDVNGDGFDDVVIGEPGRDAPSLDASGAAHLYLGAAAGLQALPAWSYAGTSPYVGVGFSVSGGADLNNDGLDDVVVGGTNWVAIHYGAAGAGPSAAPDWVANGISPAPGLGRSVSVAGDVNGDGIDDLVAGAPWQWLGALQVGAVHVYHGKAGGPLADPSWSAIGSVQYAQLGAAVAGVGDVDGDGNDDILVGDPTLIVEGVRLGAAYVYRGGPGGLAASPSWSTTGPVDNGWFGSVVAAAGDVNGDGVDDFLVSAPEAANPEAGEGIVQVYLGHNIPPALPVSLGQFRLDGVTPIPAGQLTPETGFSATASISDPDGHAVRLEVEVKTLGSSFDGDDLVSSALQSAGLASVQITGLQLGTPYRWRARAVDAAGAVSGWVNAGVTPDDPLEIDVYPRTNATPVVVSSSQVDPITGQAVEAGGAVNAMTVRLESSIQDGDSDAVSFEVEVRATGQPFTGEPTASSPMGSTAIEVALEVGAYRWRHRAVDSYGAQSDWVSFGGNGEEQADFRVGAAGSFGASSCTQSAPAVGSWMLAIPLVLLICRRVR